MRLVDYGACVLSLLGNGPDRSLKDVALAHRRDGTRAT